MKQSKYHQKNRIVETLKSEACCGSISTASRNLGISRQTIYEWRKQDRQFDNDVVEAVKDGKSFLADLAESSLVTRIKNGDTTAIIFTLKTLRKEYYGERDERKELGVLQSNSTNDGAGDFTRPLDALLVTYLWCEHNRYKAAEQNVLTPDLTNMFDEIKNVTERYKKLIE